ncbi:hypothetical protein ACE6H2_008896 [Prunus campanulata]
MTQTEGEAEKDPYILLTKFALPMSTTMLDSTLDLITQAASNSLFIFCFCNLIIVIILVGSKPISNNNEESAIHLTMPTSKHVDDEQGTREQVCKKNNALMEVSQVSNAQTAISDNSKVSSANSDNGETEGDDELRTRAEEFIEKVNKAWKAELLRNSRLFQAGMV